MLAIRGYGDEFYHRYETPDGYTVVRDQQTNIWYYAQATADGSELEPSKNVVGRDNPAASGLAKHVDRSSEAAGKIIADRYARFVIPSNWERRRLESQIIRLNSLGANATAEALIQTYNARYTPLGYSAMLPLDEEPSFSSASDPSYTPPPPMARTNVVGLCILAKFPDQPAPVATQAQMTALVNQANYVDPGGNSGSVRDYFFAQSFGKLTYTAIVTAYITADHPRSYYANQDDMMGAMELIRESIPKVTGVNLTTLTKDGTTAVAVYLLYAGAMSYDGLWPHQYTLSSSSSLPDGTRVADYMVSSIGETPVIGTICHESGHMVLNCMDYYDYGSGRYSSGDTIKSAGVGYHCLMGAGNYLNGGKTPAPIDAYLKYKLGWATVADLPASGTVTLGAADQQFRRHVKPGTPTEYFIIENKSKSASLPWNGAIVDEGLAVWHVDETVTTFNELQQMTSAQHYELSLEQADGLFQLENSRPTSTNYGDATDYFDGAAGRNTFSPTTTPNTKWWDGSSSALSLSSISAPGSAMTFTALGGAATAPTITTPTPLTSGVVGTAYSQTFAATGGTTPYTWAISAGTLPAGLTLSTAGVLSGTPTAAVVASFTVKVTGANSLFSTKDFSLTIGVAPTITTPTPLTSGAVGTAYSV
ncbi:MAG: M6 family metalloprotease domain-containing protein, partial [Verrucomicrobia bacterium]|nr:M6 family metalloprotease domain-containing protein [Verrucomicrobiota bacterium]